MLTTYVCAEDTGVVDSIGLEDALSLALEDDRCGTVVPATVVTEELTAPELDRLAFPEEADFEAGALVDDVLPVAVGALGKLV